MAAPLEIDVVIYTDGSCQGNPGPGGWGAILRWRHHRDETELSGGAPATTNNRMELMAAIAGLEYLTESTSVKVISDSQYVTRGITEWLPGWKRRGWHTSSGSPVLNADLWRRLEAVCNRHHYVSWQWVRGHSGHQENERADALARAAVPARHLR